LWAPDAKAVAVILENDTRFELTPITDGWWQATANVGEGSLYSYRIDDEVNVPDPAARFAPRGLKGPCEVVDPRRFDWTDTQWRGRPWHRAVLYELHVGTFTPEGTFAAIEPRLRELAELGINTIELLPIATFPGERGWGYDGVLPFAPHPVYGRPEDLKRLVQAAHAVGIAVVLDVVYNHFGPEGNYLHRYAESFFTDRYKTPWGSAINFEGEAGRNVREFFIQNALYWLNEYHFDGLRLDAVHAIRDASETHFVDELAAAIEGGTARERHIYLILENHDNQASRLQETRQALLSKAQWNDDFHHLVHVLLTGERDGYYSNYAQSPTESLGRVLAEGFGYQGEPYGEAREARGEQSSQLPVTAFIDFLQNHDQIGNRAFGDRLVTLTQDDQLKAGLAVLLLSPHVPLLFMGEEYAARQPFLYFCNYEGELAEAITNGRRSEFLEFKAFADASARKHIPDPNAIATFEASRLNWEERNQPPHRDWLTFVRELLQVRSEHVVPHIQDIKPGTARYTVEGSLLRAEWPIHDGTLQLEANLNESPSTKQAGAPTRILFSTADPKPHELAGWEVRLSAA
jgi:maltooligosyltrehalose trehalohydrolase